MITQAQCGAIDTETPCIIFLSAVEERWATEHKIDSEIHKDTEIKYDSAAKGKTCFEGIPMDREE